MSKIETAEWFVTMTLCWAIDHRITSTATMGTVMTVPATMTQMEIYEAQLDDFKKTYGIPAGVTSWIVNYTIVPNEQ